MNHLVITEYEKFFHFRISNGRVYGTSTKIQHPTVESLVKYLKKFYCFTTQEVIKASS